jgi:hypothetical protein
MTTVIGMACPPTHEIVLNPLLKLSALCGLFDGIAHRAQAEF